MILGLTDSPKAIEIKNSYKLPSYFSHNSRNMPIDRKYIMETLISRKIIKESSEVSKIRYSTLEHNQKEVIQKLIQEISTQNFDNIITIFIPGSGFKSLSVTGNSCELSCEHCDRKYLEIMLDVSDESKLKEKLDQLVLKDYNGCLVSGGCTEDGKVPFLKLRNTLKEYRKNTNLIFNYHTGLLNEGEIKEFRQLDPHIVSFDFTLDNEIIHNIYHLNLKSAEDYKKTFNLLKENNIRVIPHITIGLNYGCVKKEFDSLVYLRDYKHDLIVFIILIPPVNNSAFRLVKKNELLDILVVARLMFPKTELSLGCMRPRGRNHQEYENFAIKAGINRMVIPSKETLDLLKKESYNILKFNACCAVPLDLLKKEN
ncbi:MAG: hypothetical protein GF364_02565 [Candidatus Lokiarchaeota archaeon]|nr:hypothetical protein [Candidatus Lokiarchaeota archaeon]